MSEELAKPASTCKETEGKSTEISKSALKKASKLEKKQLQKDARRVKHESKVQENKKLPSAKLLLTAVPVMTDRISESASSLQTSSTPTLELSAPAGMRDTGHAEMLVRNKCIDDIRKVFLLHGGQELDTPVLERREVLMGHYGEENKKLVFDVQDQGASEDGSSKKLTMRFDLTVPFARHMAVTNRMRMKRFQIAKVYRRDNPSVIKGRMREFYQADFDISGDGRLMLADAEVITVLHDTILALDIGPFVIKISHRRLLEGLLAFCGVPIQSADKCKTASAELGDDKSETKEVEETKENYGNLFAQVCSSIDKLDKQPWSEIRQELIMKRGLAEKVVDRIGELMTIDGPCMQVLTALQQRSNLFTNVQVQTALDDLKLLFDQLELFGALPNCRLSLSLARGLGYYDGVIFEAVSSVADDSSTSKVEEKTAGTSTSESAGASSSTNSIGSIGAGGRYDNLISKFRSDGRKIPTVGCSIGIERIMALLRMKRDNNSCKVNASASASERESYAEVLIHYPDEESFLPALSVCRELWDAGIMAEVRQEKKIAIKSQIEYAINNQIPFLLVIGSKELKAETVQVRMMKDQAIVKALISQDRRKEIEETIPRSLVAQYFVNALSRLTSKMKLSSRF